MRVDRRTRVVVATSIAVVLGAALGVQALTVDRGTGVEVVGTGPYPGNTLVGVHSWRDEGRIVELNPDGEVVWEWSVPDARVFAVEQLDEETVLAAVAVKVPAARCDDEHLEYERFDDHCVHNRVVEVDRPSGEVVWEYGWFDEFIAWHEVHDVERLDNGETAVIDMGRNRAFTVDRDGDVTWRWDAEKHLGEGSAFDREHGSPPRSGEHDDWTHMNDIDRLENDNFQLSIRNFDVVLEVDPETDEVVSVFGETGNHSIMRHQHNPHRLSAHGTLIVADSGNDRVVEYDLEAGERVWTYTGPAFDGLQWPRDADRLPNGNTLVTDSRNNRILEVDPDGEIVWRFEDPGGEVIPLPYEADRIGVDEPPDAPSGDQLDGLEENPGFVRGELRRAETLARYVLPPWMHLPQLVQLAVLSLACAWLALEGILIVSIRLRERVSVGTDRG